MIGGKLLQTGTVIKVINHDNNVQLLCSDDRGLLSVYFDIKPFKVFINMVKKAGLSLKDLNIEFNSEVVKIIANGKTVRTCTTRNKTT